MPEICKKLIIKGVVQGVGFRANTLYAAQKIGGLKGYVRNLSNGDVEILVQATLAKVTELVAWAKKGPGTARVDQVLDEPVTPDPEMPAFEILD